MRYRLRIPLTHTLNDAIMDEDGDVEDEEVKDDSVVRQPANAIRDIQNYRV